MDDGTEILSLIPCAEACEYQREGYCSLCGGAPVSRVPMGGCSYFHPRGEMHTGAERDTAQKGAGS